MTLNFRFKRMLNKDSNKIPIRRRKKKYAALWARLTEIFSFLNLFFYFLHSQKNDKISSFWGRKFDWKNVSK